jgi:enamine deaminase RidA (YjgF/YER057c/UK114 family)
LRQNVSSNSPYEPVIGFSRAVRAGNNVYVSGTVGPRTDGNVIAGGAYDQAKQAIANIAASLEQAGASLDDVVRTRIYLVNAEDTDDVGRAHREALGHIMPAATLVIVKGLASPEMLVEIEADAVIQAA